MKAYYKKQNIIKIFGIKILENTSDYFERSTNKEDSEDDFQIDLKGRILTLGDNTK